MVKTYIYISYKNINEFEFIDYTNNELIIYDIYNSNSSEHILIFNEEIYNNIQKIIHKNIISKIIIDYNKFKNLKYLDCRYSNLEELNIDNIITLEYLNCSRSALHFFKLGLCPRFK